MLVKANLKQLRLPTMHAEFEKLAREAAKRQRELRAVSAAPDRTGGDGPLGQCAGGAHQASELPDPQGPYTYDFAAMPSVSKPKI